MKIEILLLFWVLRPRLGQYPASPIGAECFVWINNSHASIGPDISFTAFLRMRIQEYLFRGIAAEILRVPTRHTQVIDGVARFALRCHRQNL